MSIGSFFQKVGTDLEKFFGVVVEAAGVAEPIVDFVLPGWATLYNAAVAAAAKAEATAAAAGATAGISDSQKVALMVSEITPAVLTYAESAGLPTPTAAQIQAFATAVAATLNALPAAAATATAANATTTAPATPAPAETVMTSTTQAPATKVTTAPGLAAVTAQ
jgi:hypothetical protein